MTSSELLERTFKSPEWNPKNPQKSLRSRSGKMLDRLDNPKSLEVTRRTEESLKFSEFLLCEDEGTTKF